MGDDSSSAHIRIIFAGRDLNVYAHCVGDYFSSWTHFSPTGWDFFALKPPLPLPINWGIE